MRSLCDRSRSLLPHRVDVDDIRLRCGRGPDGAGQALHVNTPVGGHQLVVYGGTYLFFFENEKRLSRAFGKFHEPKDSIRPRFERRCGRQLRRKVSDRYESDHLYREGAFCFRRRPFPKKLARSGPEPCA